MKKQIRKNVFETNSSSTHSICIAKNVELDIPKTLQFKFGEFGWERDTLYSTYEKASYLYTGLYANNKEEDINKIKEIFQVEGIEVDFEQPIIQNRSYTNSEGKLVEYESCDNSGYVDHSDELDEFLDFVCNNKTSLFNYLFSPLSFIITGNDNDDDIDDINVNYEHDKFYKGN